MQAESIEEDKRHVTQKNLEDIFRTEGWINGLGNISENVRLQDKETTDVQVCDVVDAVRFIVGKKLIEEGSRQLSKSTYLRSVNYLLVETPSAFEDAGRFVPHLELEIIKCFDKIPVEQYARLKYRKNPDYFTFAQFDIPSNFLKNLREKGL